MLRLAKSRFDLALNAADAQANRVFWETAIQLPFQERLDIREGVFQDRYDLEGAVVKVMSYSKMEPHPPSGYHELIIARRGTGQKEYVSPDHARVRVVAPEDFGVETMGLRMKVRNVRKHQDFFQHALDLPLNSNGDVIIGDARVIFDQSDDAPSDATIEGFGWRCLTIQIFDLAAVHEAAVRAGARVAVPPTRLRDVALYSLIRDPDGNWIELSQRASLTGPLSN